MKSFFENLAKSTTESSKLCIGIDPDFSLKMIKSTLYATYKTTDVAQALTYWSETILTACAGLAPAVKFQSAYFEAFGEAGFLALKESISIAKKNGLKVVLDVKRSDIGSTMTAYGRAAFDYLNADSITVNLYHGTDTLDGLLPWLNENKSIYVLWLTSNPSFQQLQNFTNTEGSALYEHLLQTIQDYQKLHDINSIGLVLGATNAQHIKAELYSKLQNHPFLMPGIGYQNADTEDKALGQLSSMHSASLLPASRGLLKNIDFSKEELCLNETKKRIRANALELLSIPLFKAQPSIKTT